jgi:hypothetical protein
MSCRSLEKPGVIVLTFNVLNVRAGVVIFFTLVPTHTVRARNRGEATSYWLGFAQLEAGGSCPMKRNDFFHRRKQRLAPILYATLA